MTQKVSQLFKYMSSIKELRQLLDEIDSTLKHDYKVGERVEYKGQPHKVKD